MLYACAHVVSFPNQEPQSLIWERDKWTGEIAAFFDQSGSCTVSSRSSGQGLCRVHHLGKLLTYSYLRSFSKARVVSCLSKLTVVCCPVRERKSGNQLHEGEVRSRRVAGPSSDSSWQLYVTTIYLYMLGTTTTLSLLFQVLKLWSLVHLKEYSS